MFYDNKVCDGCSGLMLEGEDIVVCPECGTPQHRECYKKNNECVNAHLHAEGFDWRAANPEPEKKEEEAETQAENAAEASSQNERSEVFSSSEEIPNIQFPEVHFSGIYVNGRTVDANEDIGGVTASEAITYTQINSRHYLRKLIKHKNKKSFFLSWNWGAFAFGSAWFFYRKLYKAGAIILALMVSASIAVLPLLPAISEATEKVMPMYDQLSEVSVALIQEESEENLAEYERLLNAIWAELKPVLPETLIAFSVIYIFPRFLPALIANFFYRKKMLEDIKFAKEATSDPKVLKFSLIRRGGVSLLAGIAAYFAADYLPTAIMTIVSYFTN